MLQVHIEATKQAHDQGIVNQMDMDMSAEEAYQARVRRSQMIMGEAGEA
jgi:hypothetical protein